MSVGRGAAHIFRNVELHVGLRTQKREDREVIKYDWGVGGFCRLPFYLQYGGWVSLLSLLLPHMF